MSGLIKVMQRTGLYGAVRKIWGIVSYQQQKKKMIHFYQQIIKPKDICFDIGANIGQRSAIFLRLDARVIAVEPQPKCLRLLNKRFQQKSNITIIPEAMGKEPGEAEMMVSEADMISSLSQEWIKRVQSSGRFKDYEWNKKIKVRINTLDQLIKTYGRPVFCKIDVEGYEFQVLQGLTQPIDMISFEFTPEYSEAAIKCIKYLANIGQVTFNLSIGETMTWISSNWMSADQMMDYLQSLPDKTVFGDIYAKFEKS